MGGATARGSMNPAYLSALSALAGSAIGAIASLATTWLTQHAQTQAQHRSQLQTKREALYGDFIDEATRLFADAIEHDLTDAANLVRIVGLLNRLRLFAPAEVVTDAEAILATIIDTYESPSIGAVRGVELAKTKFSKPLGKFAEDCRRDLD